MKNIQQLTTVALLFLSYWPLVALTTFEYDGCNFHTAHPSGSMLATFYEDADGDGYGNPNSSVNVPSQPVGYVLTAGDCDDTNADIHPGAPEICDNVDNNCNGILIEGPCPDNMGEISEACGSNTVSGSGFFNYGSITNSVNPDVVIDATAGQQLVGSSFGSGRYAGFGFWSRYLLSPSAPVVIATQGDLADRIQITWEPNPLSALATEGFNIYRDGSLLSTVGPDVRSYIDFNTVAGQFYNYEVAGVNNIGEGYKGDGLGFVSPNGVVTGKVTTFNGNPVAGAVVTLTPTSGRAVSFDGSSSSFAEYSNAYPTSAFTFSSWVKIGDGNDGSAIVDFGSDIGKNYWLHTQAAGANKGVTFGIGRGVGDVTEVSYEFPAGEEDDWHYVAASFSGQALLLYVDGELIETAVATIQSDSSRFHFGQVPNGGGHYTGLLDEVRLYDQQLPQTDIQMMMNRTAGEGTPSLVAYWKFDEGIGSRAYNTSINKITAHHCGTMWTSDKPNVVNAGITDENGFYSITNINYGNGITFTAIPQKNFYFNQALEFNAVNSSYATLTDIDLMDTAAITTTINAFDFSGKQVILNKSDASGNQLFQLCLNSGNLEVHFGSQVESFGTFEKGYHHLALNMWQNGSSMTVELYQDGVSLGTKSFTGVAADWSGMPWMIGAKPVSSNVQADFFTGLIDEVVFFNDVLELQDIQEYVNIGTDVANINLYSIFGLNEGIGTIVEDMGPAMTGSGDVHNATWSTVAMINETLPHEFSPSSTLVTLNASNTSTDQVSFTDLSTIPITGVIRFENTFCFQDSVEILLNGHSLTPPVFTNEEGRFLVELEPGTKVKLTPSFGSDSTAHNFSPAFFEVPTLTAPIANVLFQNTTKREVEGQVFGGLCRKSVIPADANNDPTAIVKVKLAALNGCYEEVIQLGRIDGKFTFEDVPPIPVAVSVIEHSNSVIYNYFQIQGGVEVDLRLVKKDTTDFMYISPPNVEIFPIEGGTIMDVNCTSINVPIIKESKKDTFSNNIKVFQNYDGGKCYLDNFDLTINNGIEEREQFDTSVVDTNLFVLQYFANNVNLLAPHSKSMQVVATVDGLSATASYEVIVLGSKQRASTITTAGPAEVYGIVYDPPGDGSSATLAKGTQNCRVYEEGTLNEEGVEGGYEFEYGFKQKKVLGVGGTGTIIEIDNNNSVSFSAHISASQEFTNETEYCIENNVEVSTSDGDDIWGSLADVYWGASMNYEIGLLDILEYDTNSCSFVFDNKFSIEQTGINTDFVYSEWQIITEVMPQLAAIVNDYDDSIENGTPTSISKTERNRAEIDYQKWKTEIAKKRHRVKKATFDRNITFDAAASYTETVTSEASATNTVSLEFDIGAELEATWGFFILGTGNNINVGTSYSNVTNSTNSNSVTNTVETSFELADDDLNDFYSVGITKNAPELDYNDLEDVITESNILDAGAGVIESVGNFVGNLLGKDFKLREAPSIQTPMFKLIGGESMCPWIPGTRNREEVFIQIDEPIATNVPSNTPAVFRVTLGSQGPNGVDGLVYELGVDEGGNPDGAIIKVDGAPLINPIEFQFIGNATVEKTITVEHPGTGQFTFEDLGIYFASVCQIEHSESVGYDAGDGGFLIYDSHDVFEDTTLIGEDISSPSELYGLFYQGRELDVYFVEPCSPIDISFPQQNHTVTPGNENLFVTLNEYDNEDADLDIVRLQYRPIPGDGSWINILELTPEDFENDPVFKVVQWDMIDLKDGAYELRAVADCSGTIGGNLSPGISEVIKVIKETEAPALFGAPEPADGVLSAGDEISITFNEIINCEKVFDADGIGANINLNNIALINTETGALVPFSHQCLDNKIIISPQVQSLFINGKVLKAVATDIEDLAGNKMEVPLGAPGSPEVNYKEWEFLVDLNPLRWVAGSNVKEVINEGSDTTLTRSITNLSGAPMNFTIEGPKVTSEFGEVSYDDIPVWMNIFPLNGIIEPGEIKEITFTFPEHLAQDEYFSEINVVGAQGNKSIDVDLRVICESPEWEVDVNAFTYSMNFTLELDIQGETSTDNMDIVGAFLDGELRGKAYVEYEPFLEKYLAFMTVYSNDFIGGTVEFQIWDADECVLYGDIVESYPYAADEVFGSPNEPEVLHTNGLVLRDIPLKTGWNWISFNLDLPDPSLDSSLVSLRHPEGDLIKSQTAFSNYYDDPALNGWIGSLTELDNISMFQFRADQPDTIFMVGAPVNIGMVDIPLNIGWNWISYVPQQPMLVNDALAALNPLNGDIIKSQTAFAQFVAGFGWIGNLDFMQAPKGYLLRVAEAGTLTYPENFKGEDDLSEKTMDEVVFNTPWVVEPGNFEHSMILIGMIEKDGENFTQEGQSIGVFVNGEVRGIAQSMYVDQIDEWMFFLTMYANESGEPMDFKLYDALTDKVTDLDEKLNFSIDGQEGTVSEPMPFRIGDVLNSTEEEVAANGLFVQPNPFNNHVQIRFHTYKAGEAIVTMTDAIGRVVKQDELDALTGWNGLDWNTIGLAPGMYIVKVETEGQTMTRKVVAN